MGRVEGKDGRERGEGEWGEWRVRRRGEGEWGEWRVRREGRG